MPVVFLLDRNADEAPRESNGGSKRPKLDADADSAVNEGRARKDLPIGSIPTANPPNRSMHPPPFPVPGYFHPVYGYNHPPGFGYPPHMQTTPNGKNGKPGAAAGWHPKLNAAESQEAKDGEGPVNHTTSTPGNASMFPFPFPPGYGPHTSPFAMPFPGVSPSDMPPFSPGANANNMLMAMMMMNSRPPIAQGTSLFMQCDMDQLSDYQVLLRQQLELFQAGPEDIERNTQGRKRTIVLGQVY